MNITQQGDIDIVNFPGREILPTTEDFFLVEFACFCTGARKIVPMLFGDTTIGVKFWRDEEGKGKPTIIQTSLKWKTFDMDDNILVMVNGGKAIGGSTITILVTKKYHD